MILCSLNYLKIADFLLCGVILQGIEILIVSLLLLPMALIG